MIQKIVRLLAFCFCCTLSIASIAQAPVVDDSENFAMLDNQEAPSRESLAKAPSDYADTDEEIALARDNEVGNREDVDFVNKMKGLQQEVQELRGQLEMQAHEMKLLQQQQLSFYKDIDTRLRGTPGIKADSGPALSIESPS
ncbi:MAG: tol-pal system protein YbgF, partial [Cyanobacteria bacterium]|nr:tol-pal system protein YbgF [Cyanobacteriota bacterium]